MQKLDLRKNLNEVILKTKSETILDFFKNVNKQPAGSLSALLLNLLIESKAGFDQSALDEKQKNILEQFCAQDYYETKFFTSLIHFISINNYELTIHFLQNSKNITKFYTFHNTLLTTYQLVDNLLFQGQNLKESVNQRNYEDAEENGFISFEIMSENSIDFQSFSIVVSSLNGLIEAVSEVISRIDNIVFDQPPKLVLADSGSNTVISLKLPKEISKSISQIINDAWLYFTNNTGFKFKKLNTNLSEALEIVQKIKKAEDDKLISSEQAELWKRKITMSTEAILMNKTLTKEKAEEMYIISNQKMLSEATARYLTEGEK